MGIPGLASLLRKSAVEERLGCCSATCPCLSGVVIDGPSLAYWIYNNLARGFTVEEDIHIRPSFELIRYMTLEVLNLLEEHNVKILRIYFDGGLPAWKTEERKDRLRKDHRQRTLLRVGQPAFMLKYSSRLSLGAEDLLETGPSQHKTRIDLVSPFLVPLVIESLHESSFSGRTEIVPGEADAWCVAFAKKHGATILTSDSDLAVYDLENGRVVFLDSLQKRICDKCMTPCVVADILQPAKLAQALSTNDVKHAAFDLLCSKDDQQRKVASLAKKHSKIRHVSSSSSVPDFEEFCARYQEIDLEGYLNLRKTIQLTDPRLSEVVEQLRRPTHGHITSILPSIIDDPSRKSAWLVSESIRDFSYSLLWQVALTRDISLFEYLEKGQPIGHGRKVRILDEKQCTAACSRLFDFLQTIRTSSADTDDNVSYWRSVCTIHVCYWCLAADFSSTNELSFYSSTIWHGLKPSPGLSWLEIHFRGQLEATYYAFRQICQILRTLELVGSLDQLSGASALHQTMADLPTIVEIFEDYESSLKHPVDIDRVITMAQEMLEN